MAREKTAATLWAITNATGEVVWSRGGSSTPSKLMVYDSLKKAEAAMHNSWTRQVHDPTEVEIREIYSAPTE